ncbi:hypothetical protein M9H77_32091 [Catharanthus roseus]|uniref:Uncharacterized protein n=1 Tax=Catharanthus roseus TaxID=4058 RepID=A0ACC0A2T8_CATRO|nr:hypothetical protein M9H77_32091 [Catharanthus roseus]
MLCRRHINQNVLAKLTELIKNEEVKSRFINGSWKKLWDEVDEQEYLMKLDALKTKWKSRPDFLHYLFNNWLNPFAHKFVTCWTKTGQQVMDSEMHSLTDLLHQISTGPISKVREMRRLAKGVLNPVLPEDPMDLFLVLALDLGRCPGSGSGSGSRGKGRPPRAPRERGRGHDRGRSNLSAVKHASPCSTFPYTNAFPTFIYPFISNWKNVIGDGNCGYRVVADFVFGDEHQ